MPALSLVGSADGSQPLATIPRAPLRNIAEDDRFRAMDRCEAYFRGKQDEGKTYDWDGRMSGYGGQASIKPGWYVPHKLRKPSTRYDMAKMIVRRLTSMLFGQDHFPEIRCEGDPDAEDFARELCTAARLKVRMAEARDLGGATGTAVLSFGFVRGAPRVKVHNAKHVTVLEWADEEELRPARVLKAYSTPRAVFDPQTQRTKRVDFWQVCYWDAVREVRWRNIPAAVAARPDWMTWPDRSLFVHDYGFCPVYWIQNRPCGAEFDGESDYEGQEDTLDEINRLLSATTKGTISNVDPTLVIKQDPAMNQGSVFKGSENAIFSPGGAEYLELKGTAVQAAERQLEKLRGYVLDVAGVVMADPEKLAGAAQSARALEILYAPMLANCDILRGQYGEHGIKQILLDMLRVARKLETAPAVEDPETGELYQPKVILPPRMERRDRAEGDEGEGDDDGRGDGDDVVAVERKPGSSEQIVLNWRPYFAPTWADIQSATTAVGAANGGKPTISQRTSVQVIAALVGVEDVDAELERIEEEADAAMEKAQQALAADRELFDDDDDLDDDEPPGKPGKKPPPGGRGKPGAAKGG